MKDTMVGHYRIVEKIGAGGMGEVYLAEDTELDRKVALKFLPLHFCQDEDCRGRFTREAKAAAKLDHPNIVPVYEVGEFRNRPFYAMAHIEGKSLRDVIKQGKLSVSEATQFTVQILEGLHKAHESGVIHRDIKPSNIIIDNENRPRILDFGLATVVGEDKLTKTGSTLGTVGYMSPEQIEGKQLDKHSDLFSVGVILYEMLTGRRPFEGDNEAAIARAVTDTTPEPVARYKSGTTGELQHIVDKALTKDPSLRYQYAEEFGADLKRCYAETGPAKKRRMGLWVVFGLIILLGIYLGYRNFIAEEVVSDKTSRKMLAVLPFENLGGEEDEGFADGITDAITSQIAKIGGLGVISRTSAMQYKDTDKSLRQIGSELGVGYILEGTILWDKTGDTDRMRIIPQLIQVSDDSHIWTEIYERAMIRIFEVQEGIALSIAKELDVTLLQPERQALAKRPTENMEAYQAFLAARGYEWKADEIPYYERAIELDSNFAEAYAALSMAHSWQYQAGNDRSMERLRKAKEAVDHALELSADLPQAYLALGFYYYWGFRQYDIALEYLKIAEKGLPNDSRLYEVMGYIFRRQGRFEDAFHYLELAYNLDPSDVNPPYNAIEGLICLNRIAEANRLADRILAVHPKSIGLHRKKYLLHILEGNLPEARATLLADPLKGWWSGWVTLHNYERDFQAALDTLKPRGGLGYAFEDSLETVSNWEGLIYRYMGDSSKAAAAFDSSRVWLESRETELGASIGFHTALGIAYAGLGRKEDAVREGLMAVEKFPISRDAIAGPIQTRRLAIIYVMVGENNSAVELIDSLMRVPSYDMNLADLRLDPIWDPLRNHPRFQALLEKYDNTN